MNDLESPPKNSQENKKETSCLTEVWKAVERTVRLWEMWDPGDTVMVACSGGPDSICLLHLLTEMGKQTGIHVVSGHVDHGLRDSSKKDAEFVKKWGKRRGVPVLVREVQVLGKGENAARKARYRALRELANTFNARVVATAHTADDQAETVLMRLIRGTGTRGMGGIPPKRNPFVRPLISVTCGEVGRYLEEQGIQSRLDPTNLELDPFRNRVRHHWIPALKEENPRIVQALSRLAESAREESSALEALVRGEIDEVGEVAGRKKKPLTRIHGPDGTLGVRFETKGLPQEATWRRAMVSYLARFAFEEVARNLKKSKTSKDLEAKEKNRTIGQLERHHVLDIHGEIQNMEPDAKSYRRLSLPGGMVGLVAGGWAAVLPEGWMEVLAPQEWEVGPGDCLDPTGFLFSHWKNQGQRPHPKTLHVRTWLPGDRVKISEKHKKLQDFFVDKGVPAPLRRRIPLWENTTDGEAREVCPVRSVGDHTEDPWELELSTPQGCAIFKVRPHSLEAALWKIFGTFGL